MQGDRGKPAAFVPISQSRHRGYFWSQKADYRFAASMALVPIVTAEASAAAQNMPLVFVRNREGQVDLMALLSLAPCLNAYVDPSGQWLSGYIPALLRVYPFRALAIGPGENAILGVDEASRSIADSGTDDEAFFLGDGRLSKRLAGIAEQCALIHKYGRLTRVCCEVLDQCGVLMPFAVQWSNDTGDNKLDGLLRVDEGRLESLDEEAFLKLRKEGTLSLAYAQVFSMGRLTVLRDLMRLAAPTTSAPEHVRTMPGDSLDGLFGLSAGETLRFL